MNGSITAWSASGAAEHTHNGRGEDMATYTTKNGDMWDSIAYAQLGSTSYTDLLINANLQHKGTYLFPSGVVLTLPEVEKPINNLLPPWKRKGAGV